LSESSTSAEAAVEVEAAEVKAVEVRLIDRIPTN